MLWILKKTQDFAYKFDLLFRGLETTSGGQRIHDYDEQVAKMKAQGLNPDDFKNIILKPINTVCLLTAVWVSVLKDWYENY